MFFTGVGLFSDAVLQKASSKEELADLLQEVVNELKGESSATLVDKSKSNTAKVKLCDEKIKWVCTDFKYYFEYLP